MSCHFLFTVLTVKEETHATGLFAKNVLIYCLLINLLLVLTVLAYAPVHDAKKQ
jgi:hypothetical protein